MPPKDKGLHLVGGVKLPADFAEQMALASSYYEADNAVAYIEVLERAISAGNTEAMAAMASYLLWDSWDDYTDVSDQDVKKAMHLLRQAVLGGSAYAHYLMGIALLDGDFIAENTPQGVRHLEIAFEKGHPASAYELARIAELEGRMEDYIEYLLAGVDRGVANAYYTAGLLFLDGELLPHDPLRGHTLIATAVESQCCSWEQILDDYLERKKKRR